MNRIRKIITGALIYAVCGMMFEVFFTGMHSWTGKNFRGGVSLLMGILYFLIYFAAPYLFRLIDRTGLKNVFLRAFPITVLIYIFEYLFGLCCQWAGFLPWKYTSDHLWEWGLGMLNAQGSSMEAWGRFSDWSHGNITLDMLPVWFCYALLIEQFLVIIASCADHICENKLLTWKKFWSLVGQGNSI